jgi:hypothetical protein
LPEIGDFIDTMKPMATANAGSATMLMPTVKDLIDVNVKNNEQLIKMAAIAQRAATSNSNSGTELIDMSEIHKDITNTLFKKTSYRVNIILGLILIFSILLFIYFGINNNRSQDEYIPIDSDSLYYQEEQPINKYIDPTELALMS